MSLSCSCWFHVWKCTISGRLHRQHFWDMARHAQLGVVLIDIWTGVNVEGAVWGSDDRCRRLLFEAEEGTGDVETSGQVTFRRTSDGQLSTDPGEPCWAGSCRSMPSACLSDFINKDACTCWHAQRNTTRYSVTSLGRCCTTDAWYSVTPLVERFQSF